MWFTTYLRGVLYKGVAKVQVLLYDEILSKHEGQMAKILRISLKIHKAQFPKLSAFIGRKLIFSHYCTQNVKDGAQIGVYKTNNITRHTINFPETVRKVIPPTHKSLFLSQYSFSGTFATLFSKCDMHKNF